MSPPFPEGRFGVIYADPPWRFETYSEKGKGRSPERHYACMSLADIKALPVQSLAAEDCALFLWVTYPMLRNGLDVLQAWGFRFSTVAFTWAKELFGGGGWHMGTGYWTRANPEIVLLGLRGHPKRVRKDIPNLVVCRIGTHSRKPPIVRNQIVRLMGDVPRIELFAREAAEGWSRWGLEAPP